MNGALLPFPIAGLTADSRQVEPGFLFAALPGAHTDGRRYVAEAVQRGAVAVLAPADGPPPSLPPGVRLVIDPNPRRRLARLAAAFHARQPAVVAAVTGTNGKTSVADFTRQLWTTLGQSAASIGTLGVVVNGQVSGTGHTTPDPVTLYRVVARLAAGGVGRLAIEASSHGLDQYRLDGLRISAAAFTNLTRDHLDYHGSMEAYAAAKRRLFDELLPPGAPAVVNADDPAGAAFAEAAGVHGADVLTYGRDGGAFRLTALETEADALVLGLDALGRRARVRLPLVGGFQASNALAALGMVVALGAEPADAIGALERLVGVPGRLQHVGGHRGGAVFVDYAHTPDALETACLALRPHARGRLVVVFGCGGDRDRGKRPMMGAIATRLADRVYVTDDNPRSEPADAIRREVLVAAPGAIDMGDRREAIFAAIRELGPGDVLLIAGKGHEQGQIVGDRVLPFDDVAVARAAMAPMEIVA